ncbi:hypothetical protein [Peribacillus frigoritolerans]|uniref:hypothetical protein n=1 Tax=Peribacillus frigoritolerans TaxID=450367 RepID=UPI00207AABA9|nr:hypothetical protein [Peribacillus frigoritolerans]USK66890.1 hypothetical protein LIT26_09865 [Peribacillus frigoritolerans]
MISHRLLVNFGCLIVISAYLLMSSCCTGDFAPFTREFWLFTRDFGLFTREFVLYW